MGVRPTTRSPSSAGEPDRAFRREVLSDRRDQGAGPVRPNPLRQRATAGPGPRRRDRTGNLGGRGARAPGRPPQGLDPSAREGRVTIGPRRPTSPWTANRLSRSTIASGRRYVTNRGGLASTMPRPRSLVWTTPAKAPFELGDLSFGGFVPRNEATKRTHVTKPPNEGSRPPPSSSPPESPVYPHDHGGSPSRRRRRWLRPGPRTPGAAAETLPHRQCKFAHVRSFCASTNARWQPSIAPRTPTGSGVCSSSSTRRLAGSARRRPRTRPRRSGRPGAGLATRAPGSRTTSPSTRSWRAAAYGRTATTAGPR